MKYVFFFLTCILLATPASAQIRINQDTINALQQQMIEQQIQAEIDKLDLNGDGMISRSEYDAKADSLFLQLDTDRDGMITQAERDNARSKLLQPAAPRRSGTVKSVQ